MTKTDILKAVKEKGVKFIRLQFTDIFGTLKNVAILDSQLERVLEDGCMFDGSAIDGFARIEESDMYLRPDFDTFAIFAGHDNAKIARLICDVYTTDGMPFTGDPRNSLKLVLAEAKEMGFDFFVGPECEFFLFNMDENGRPTTDSNDRGGYFDLGSLDHGEKVRRQICLELEEMGFLIETSHHECANAQHEIDFRYSKALKAADNIMTFKHVVKSVARRFDMHATFMPKPVFEAAGSGMHINMSLFKNSENAFYNEKDELGLSSEAYMFIAGILNHAKGMTAINNQLVNSYKRLVPGYEAPCYIAWSASNRSPLVRVPNSKGAATRIELRSPDPAANPYLVLACCLKAGLDGIRSKLTPPEPVNSNIYELSRKEIAVNHIESLPSDLREAVSEFKKDNIIREAVGEHIYKVFNEAKNAEWADYSGRVSQWELDEYLYRT